MNTYSRTVENKKDCISASVWIKTTLILSCVGGAWADPPTSKKGKFFLMLLALSVPIFLKNYRNVSNLKIP